MSRALAVIKAQALQLDPNEREELIEVLIDSFDSRPEESAEAITAAWRTEIAQRLADIKAGKTRFIPADEAMRKLRSRLDIE
jgi:putative addiction module component (TIGR02574 family)